MDTEYLVELGNLVEIMSLVVLGLQMDTEFLQMVDVNGVIAVDVVILVVVDVIVDAVVMIIVQKNN